MKISLGKFIHFKLSCLFIFFLFVLLYISGSLYWIFTENYLGEPALVEINKCPVCYGESLCQTLLRNQIKLSNLAKVRFLDIFGSNSDRMYHATLNSPNRGNTEIVLKKLGKNHDLSDLDALICSKAKMADDCDVSSAISKLSFVKQSGQDAKFAKYLQGSSKMFYCPSTRLVSELFNKYKERSATDEVTLRDRVKIWSTAIINQEPLLLQMFPAADGWPFPEYVGACGRYVAVGNGGKQLSAFYNANWSLRADIAYQLMKIAEMLTNNKADFALYLTDVIDDNFAVDADGNVTVIDLEDVLVVDKLAVKSAKPKGWEDVHESVYAECPGKTFKSCHSFSEVHLCSHVTSDHNYYAICRYILTPHHGSLKKDPAQADGLLHDIPKNIDEDWDLEYLLNECVSPKRQRGRIQVVHKIIEALDHIRKL
ncbi:divergent protein kinase domain 2A-like [Mercenaria mercenaria]|uniref:divergent protein kinase domain 2A-like n=1 Tax=Mercenaria mercenaria TaxID=6596 RepID=UPI00234E52E3|nr:divergent protein kinase domain 2A-like [Mercenaria mercenaria]XP_045201228.2 divergent protein kinase domain 2A-like [Mercenaria mercenaria]XP_045201230.2 divergent protein kinase domain 2A-like [Mercenaria mercenaria]XP_053403569.1 divergent protein kinase domain 2A-like [Mercenaria mercenaria]XP_053403570.1 divergent protein kinase domain 2A-like [Mercenaria mercenaria]